MGCAPDVPRGLINQSDITTLDDIAVRDELIAAQVSMLNIFRCQFDFETEIVPGGCVDGRPIAEPPEPASFEGAPTQQDVADREELIMVQESLLNVYRCQFGIDTHAVPGGCPEESDPVGAPLVSRTARPLA